MKMKQGQENSTQLRFVRRISQPSQSDNDEKVPVVRIQEVKETPQNAQSVHIFDGKLLKVQIQNRTPEEKKVLFSEFKNRISIIPVANPSIMRNIDVIMGEMGSPHNYLMTDGIYADDVLAEIIDIMIHKDTDIIPIFLEMFLDMNTGICPSGRCVRLYQLLLAIRDI